MLLDPVILQVPSAATAFSGTFTGPGGTSSLTFTQVVGNLRADLNTNIVPEPGTQLVIVDFPGNPPASTMFNFTLHFELPGNVSTVPIKALAAAKLTSGGQTFYPPLMPCETNFANIPGVNLAQSPTFQAVNLPSPTGRGCANKVYQFAPLSGAPGIPAIGTLGAVALATLLAVFGMVGPRRRRG